MTKNKEQTDNKSSSAQKKDTSKPFKSTIFDALDVKSKERLEKLRDSLRSNEEGNNDQNSS